MATVALMENASAIYETEELQKHAILAPVSTSLCIGMAQVVNPDLTSSNISVIVMLTGEISEMASALLHDDKWECGEEGSGSTQAVLSMIRCWCSWCLYLTFTHGIIHSTASSETTPAVPLFFSQVLAHGLPCWGLFLQTKLWSSVSLILIGLVLMLH